MKVRGPDGTLYDFPDDTKQDEIDSFFNPKPEVKLPPEYMRVNMAGIGPFGPPAPEEVIANPLLRLGAEERALAGKAIETVGETATDIAGAALAEYGILPPERGKGLLQLDSYPITAGAAPGLLLRQVRPDVAKKLDVAAGELISGFTEPGLLLTAPLGGTRAGAAYFLGATAQAIPEQLQALAEAPGLPEFSAEALKTGANVTMGGLLGRGLARPGVRALREGVTDASRIKEAAEAHGDLRAPSREGLPEVPAEEGGEGVRPQAQRGLAEGTQVLLNQATEVNRGLGLGHEIQILDNFGLEDPEHSQLFKATPASVDANGNFLAPGKISLSRAALNLLSEQVSPEVLAKTLQSTLIEEGVHALTTPGESAAYLATLTRAEIALGRKLYLKGWTEAEAGLRGRGYLGYELLRRRVQQLMGLETSEIADLAGRERWTAKSLEFLANIIRRFRELIGTGAAKGGQAIARGVLDRMERNLEAARGKVAEGVSPPVVRNVPRGSIPLQSIVPAIRLVGGELVPGKHGETHPDIIKRENLKAEDIDQRGFSDPTGKSFFLDREAAAQGTDIATEMEPERMHSTDQIREMEEPGGVETEPPTGPVPPAEPGAETPFALRREREKKPGMMGQADNGEVFAKRVPDITDALHPELGFSGRETWRYDEKSNTAYWNYEPSEEAKSALDNFFARNGKPNVKQKTLTDRELNQLFGIPSLRRKAAEQHSRDMDFARRLVNMGAEQFQKEGRAFNTINLRMAERITPDEAAELEELRQDVAYRIEEAKKRYQEDPSFENQTKLVTEMQKPQFYNEALRKHYELSTPLESQALDPRTGLPLTATESLINRIGPAALRRRNLMKETPKEEDRAVKVWNGQHASTARGLLGKAISEGWFDDVPGQKALAQKLHDFGEKGVGFNVDLLSKYEPGELIEFQPMYFPDEHFIHVPDGQLVASYAKQNFESVRQVMSDILLHEYVHGLTVQGLERGTYRAQLLPIMEKLRGWLNQNTPDPLLNSRIKYALKGPEEFLATTFEHPEIQDILKELPATDVYKGRSLISNAFDAFVRWIGRIIGFEDHQAISDVLKIAFKLAELREAARLKQPGLFGEDFMAALRRKKPTGPELPMGKITPSGRLTQPERVPAAEALAAHQAAAYQPLTANALATVGDHYFASTTAPSLEDYTGAMSRSFGPMKPGQLKERFEEAFWRWTERASGKDITAALKDSGLAKKLRLETPEGEVRRIADPIDVEEQRARGGAQPAAQPGIPGLVPERPIMGALDTGAQRLRANAIAALAEKLIIKGEGSRSFLKRREIDPVEDLADPRVETKQPVYHEIDQKLEADPAKLGAMLTDDARAPGGEKVSRVVGGQVVTVRKKGFPVSASKRLTAIQNRSTGKVSLVTTYRDGRRGPVMVDPGVPGTEVRSTVENILKRYRVIASTLLDEPVQDFRKDYADLGTYQREYGREARASGERAFGREMPPQVTEAEVSRVAPSEMVTPDEADRIMDQLLGEVDKVESPEDVKLAWENLKDDPASRAALTGLRKLGREIMRKEPGLGAEQFLDKLARLIYENHTQAQTLEDFQRRTMEASRPPSGKAAGLEAVPEPAPAPTTGREISIADPRRLPPGLRGALRRPEPVTQYGTARPEEPARTLTPEEAEYVGTEEYRRKMGSLPTVKESRALAQFRAGEDFDRIISEAYYAAQEAAETGEEAPAALRRRAHTAADESRRIAAGVAAMYQRRDVMREFPRMLDAAENVAHDEAFRAENHIRGATRSDKPGMFYGNPDVLSAANAVLAAGAIEPQYAWTPLLRQKLRDLMNGHPGSPHARKLMRSPDPGEVDRGRAMFARIRRESIQQMVQGKDLPAEAPSYTFNPARLTELDTFDLQVEKGLRWAEAGIRSSRWATRIKGFAWKKAAQDLAKELAYARAHWGDTELAETAMRMRRELDRRYDREKDAGYEMKYDTDYMPGRYDAEFFNDNSVLFGSSAPRLLGTLFRKQKTFRNYYHAISDPDGPYIAMTRDGANLIGHRVRQSERQIQYQQWAKSLLNYTDPVSGKPVAIKAKQLKSGGWGAPDKDYEVWYYKKSHEPIAVRRGVYLELVNRLTEPSKIQNWAPSRFVLEWGQRLKHTILLGDFFHLSRLSYYSLAIMGLKEGMIHGPFRRGLTALEFRETDIPEAVRNGIISEAEANWALERIPVRFGNLVRQMSRVEILREFETAGLNIGRIQDAIYKDLVRSVPLLGRYNKWLFDRFTRGLMAQSAVMEFERQHKASPQIPPERLIRDISRDVNRFFGSIGRQGVFDSKSWQDAARMVFLAPQWVEGLIDKEVSSAARIAGTPLHAMGLYRKGLNPLGTMGRGIGRGMLAMLALTQVLNLIGTWWRDGKPKPTWDNEDGHKWDAWIPTRDGQGLYLSPLAVFNEISHDLVRLGHSKPRFIDAVNQIGSNKLSPWGRLGIVLYTGLTPTREYIPTSAGVVGKAAEQLVPVPISFGRISQAAGHAVAPGLVPPTAPGAVERQALATFGLKAEPAAQPALITTRWAEDFVRKQYGKTEAIKILPTTEPSYSKLRNALRVKDYAAAKRILSTLQQTKKDRDIIKFMKLWARHPFTGANKYEKEFLDSLSPEQQAVYDKAVEQKETEYQNFLEWFSKQQ